jgi:predicted RNase H-like HicB family nuclease
MKYTVIIEKGQESGFVAYVPALKGCVSQGKTKIETMKNIKEAMEVYVEALIEDGLPVPKEIEHNMVELEVAAR